MLEPIEEWTLVLVHWNRAEACLATVQRFLDQGSVVSVLVVDNGSRPEELERLRGGLAEHPPLVELIETGANLGFGPGANAGLRAWLDAGTTEWCLLAPHDAAPDEGCLASLGAAIATEPMAGLACADVGDGLTPMIDPYFGGVTRAPSSPGPGWEAADYPHGTLMALRRACLEEIGLFDEAYFSYCEEADLGHRATRAGLGDRPRPWRPGAQHPPRHLGGGGGLPAGTEHAAARPIHIGSVPRLDPVRDQPVAAGGAASSDPSDARRCSTPGPGCWASATTSSG